ncbi:hypothetical protein GCM10023196_012580 [Actinoallomurus vinaceus]|uniref:Uncharacterized protein n=1 Tax=Actinoallomurus vinaceus TaxID=1080074 RepID=A0ABP8U422_9ACTN
MSERSDPSRLAASNGHGTVSRFATVNTTSDAVADSCAVIISRLLAVGLDLEMALGSRRRDQAARRIRRAIGEIDASLVELHRTVLDAAVRRSSGDGEAVRAPKPPAAESPHR